MLLDRWMIDPFLFLVPNKESVLFQGITDRRFSFGCISVPRNGGILEELMAKSLARAAPAAA